MMNGSKEVQSRLARDLSRANFLPPTYDCNTSRQQGISCPLNEHLTCTSRNPNLKHSQKASMLPWEPLPVNAFARIVNVQQVLSLHKLIYCRYWQRTSPPHLLLLSYLAPHTHLPRVSPVFQFRILRQKSSHPPLHHHTRGCVQT